MMETFIKFPLILKKSKQLSFSVILFFAFFLNGEERQFIGGDNRHNLKDALAFHGIDFSGSFIYHFDSNLLGGIKRGVLNQWLVDMSLLFHSEKILGFNGGSLFVNFQGHEGKNPSSYLTGDALIFDGLSSPNFVQLSEYWFQQKIGKFSATFGRIDALNHFAFTKSADLILNNAEESIPTILGFPTYPSASPGLILRYDWQKELQLKLGFFNGQEAVLSLIEIYPFGIWKDFFTNLFVIFEAEGNFLNDAARYCIGLSYNRYDILNANVAIGSVGLSGYFIGEYTAFEKYHGFIQAGIGNRSTIPFPEYLGLGVKIEDPICLQWKNYFSCAVTTGFFSHKYPLPAPSAVAEISLEATYRLIYHHIGIQPDIQYIIRPGGFGLPNALAFILSLDISI